MTKEGFRHLAAGGIARAEEKNERLVHENGSIVLTFMRLSEYGRGKKRSSRATSTRLPNFACPSCILFQLRHVGETTAKAVEQSLVEGTGRSRQRVVAPKTGFANLDQSGLPEVSEMPRDSRLRHIQHLDEVPDAEFSIDEQMENPQTVPVGERPEHYIELS
jgi:hypothetical protein